MGHGIANHFMALRMKRSIAWLLTYQRMVSNGGGAYGFWSELERTAFGIPSTSLFIKGKIKCKADID